MTLFPWPGALGRIKMGRREALKCQHPHWASWLIMIETELPTMPSQSWYCKPSETVDTVNLSPCIISTEYFYHHNEKVWHFSSLVKMSASFFYHSPGHEFHLCIFSGTEYIDCVKYLRDF